MELGDDKVEEPHNDVHHVVAERVGLERHGAQKQVSVGGTVFCWDCLCGESRRTCPRRMLPGWSGIGR